MTETDQRREGVTTAATEYASVILPRCLRWMGANVHHVPSQSSWGHNETERVFLVLNHADGNDIVFHVYCVCNPPKSQKPVMIHGRFGFISTKLFLEGAIAAREQ